MSDRIIALVALYVVAHIVAACAAGIKLKKGGYVLIDKTSRRWLKIAFATSRSRAGTRIIVNMIFWTVLFIVLLVASRGKYRVPILAVQGSAPLSAEKFSEYADGELWVLQLTAALFVFILICLVVAVTKLMKRRIGPLRDSQHFIIDDFWGVVLNFGSMFMISGWLQVFDGKIRFLCTLGFGALNLVLYAFCSNLEPGRVPEHVIRPIADLPVPPHVG